MVIFLINKLLKINKTISHKKKYFINKKNLNRLSCKTETELSYTLSLSLMSLFKNNSLLNFY